MPGESVDLVVARSRSERATFFPPPPRRDHLAPALLLLDERSPSPLAELFSTHGFAVLAPHFDWGTSPDRAALADLEFALAWLAQREDVDRSKLAALGHGRGGTLAFLLGCTSRRVAAVANAHGPVLYPSLDAARPTQPLELALNLTVPLLVVGRESEGSKLLRRLLAQGAKHAEFAERDDDGAQALRFLREALELA